MSMQDEVFLTRAQRIVELRREQARLATQTDIPDMLAYAGQWVELADKYKALGAPANEETCRSNARRYKLMAESSPGHYEREVSTPFSTIRKIEDR